MKSIKEMLKSLKREKKENPKKDSSAVKKNKEPKDESSRKIISDNEEHEELHIDLGKSKKRSKFFYIKLFLLIILILIISAFALVTLSYARHRQRCSYNSQVENGKLEKQEDETLCRDFFDNSNWSKIALDLFDFNFKDNLKASTKFEDSELTVTGECLDELDPVCWLKQLEGELEQTDGYTNLLVVGSDSRSNEDIVGNTDSIMVISFHNPSGEVLLTSFPRDLLLKNTDIFGNYETLRINAIYAIYETSYGKGIEALNHDISQVIGKPIHYYAYFNFDTFNKIIDQIGGVTIDLEEPFEDVYPCNEVPEGEVCNYTNVVPGYGLYQFPEGINKFDSFDALVYSRARYLSSDYARAQRQQNLVKAILNTILEQEGSVQDKFNLGLNVYETVNKNVQTNITEKDISGLFKLYDKLTGDVATVVLDPTLANGSLIGDFGYTENYAYSVQFYDYSYQSLQNYIAKTWEYLPYFIEEPKIRIVLANGVSLEMQQSINDFVNSDNPYLEYSIDNSAESYKGIRVYDLSKGEKSSVVEDLLFRIPEAFLYSAELEEITPSEYGEDILIIVGE